MHLVTGERVFPQLAHVERTRSSYGAFLLGCVLVDVHTFVDIDLRRTHFSAGLYGVGQEAFDKSCQNLLTGLDAALLRPWDALSAQEQAFVAGYMCHLAADESWRAFCWRLLHKYGLTVWADLPVPIGVLMTAYHILGAGRFADRPALVSALVDAEVPDVLRYIPHDTLHRMWAIWGPHALDGRTPASYYSMLERMGASAATVRATREAHEQHWEAVMSFIREQEELESLLASAVERSMEAVPRLW
jgi:hypothetical protein